MNKLLLIFILLFSSCSLFKHRVDVQFDQGTFNTNWEKWRTLNISNYNFVIRYYIFTSSVFCSNKVSNNSAVYYSDIKFPYTMGGMFEYIINDYKTLTNVWATDEDIYTTGLFVNYNSNLFYPTTAWHTTHIPEHINYDGMPVLFEIESFTTN